jgi:ABC-type nitrate/sulfonate/bicarbonate transport system permease component
VPELQGSQPVSKSKVPVRSPFASIKKQTVWCVSLVSAEMIGAEFGIGAFVLQVGNLMQTDQLLAGLVILSLFGLAVGRLINLLETRLLHWR